VLVGYARQQLAGAEGATGPAARAAPAAIDPDVAERLRRLGYLVD
jgi:hypothetical protein